MNGYPQTEKFIEVIVSDTLQLKLEPNFIQYRIEILNDSPISDKKNNLKSRENELLQIFKDLNLEFFQSEETTFAINPKDEYQNIEYVINLNSPTYLKQLYEKLKKIDNISAYISEVKYATNEHFEDELLKKVFQKAEKEAKKIAQFSQSKLGKVLLYSDVPDSQNFDFATSVIPGWHTTIYPPIKPKPQLWDWEHKTILSKTIKIRFELIN